MTLATAAPYAVAHWTLDETSGNATDTVNAYVLTDNNSVGTGTGKLGNARDFESGSSQYLSITDNADLSMGDIDFVLRCWVNLESKTTSRTIIGKWNSGGSQREYYLHYNVGPDRFQFQVSNNGVGTTQTTVNWSASPSASTWYLIHCWHDATNDVIGIAVNAGTAVTAAHSAGVNDGSAAFALGSVYGGAAVFTFDGLIDDVVVIKNYILDATERTEDYNAGTGVPFSRWTDDLSDAVSSAVAHWPLDETSGTRADSVDSNDLTDNNSVLYDTGKFGNAADFESSSSQSLTIASNSDLETGDIDFTFRAWIKLEAKGGSYMAAIGKVQSDGATVEYYIIYRPGSARLEFVAGTAVAPATNFGDLSTGVWYLVHAWHDSVANEVGIAVNGVVNTVSHSGGVTPRATAQFALGTLGSYSDSNSYWDGLIDDVVLLKGYILTAGQRTLDYNGGTGVAFADWAGGGGIEGAAAITLGALTTSSAGTVAVAGTASITLGALTTTADGDVTVVGTSSITLGSLAVSADGDVTVVGTAAITLGALTVVGEGLVGTTGTASITLGDLTVAGAGTVTIVGTSAITLGALTTSADGDVTVVGASSITLGALTTSADGDVALVGAAGITLAALTVASEGVVGAGLSGEAAITLGALTVSSAGTVAVSGAAAITLGTLTVQSAGTVTVVGTGSITLAALTLSSAGVVADLGDGSAAITLGALTVASAGTVTVSGSGTITLGALITAGTGTVTITGTSAVTLGTLTTVSTGTVAVTGTLTATLGALTLTSTGSALDPIVGESAVTLAALTVVGAGLVLDGDALTPVLVSATINFIAVDSVTLNFIYLSTATINYGGGSMVATILDDINVGSEKRLQFTIQKNGTAWDLSAGSVAITIEMPDRTTTLTYAMVAEDASAGIFYYDLLDTDISQVGYHTIGVEVTIGGKVFPYDEEINFYAGDHP